MKMSGYENITIGRVLLRYYWL